jgi:GntP family gluconate:H+ symporter
MIAMTISLATGLYVVHCLVPPHPGASAAAVAMGVDFGKLIVVGAAVAIPGMIAGHLWALYSGKKFHYKVHSEDQLRDQGAQPSVLKAFLPVIIPILFIAINSFLTIEKNNDILLKKMFSILGEPVVALSAGVILALATIHWTKHNVGKLLQESAEKAGGILVIIGAGGAFGAVLAAAKIGEHFGSVMDLHSLGILFPFLLGFILKTAQGSSTVAIITASSIALPLLPSLGLDDEKGRLLSALAMGAGSMMISHANDAYFWVISKFSGLDMRTMLRTYSVASIITGLVTFLAVYVLSLFM